MGELAKVRRNIHTYPFKYEYIDPQEFFALDKGSIYIHIPFCSTKCHFCDYTVYTDKGADVRARYVDALCHEIERYANNRAFPAFEIEAIYLGGGTPGLLTGDELVKIFRTCRENFHLSPDCEVCAEFDPAAVEYGKIQQVLEGGYNRLSMGIQCFNDEILRQSNRPHNLKSVYAGFEAMRKAGCKHLNIDLIYPLPNLTQEIWQDSVKKAIDLKPDCITVYGLEIWPGTAYYNWLKKGKMSLPDGNAEVKMYEYAVDQLEEAGFLARSNSGYYHPDRTSRYCRFLDYYWRTWPMIGFGVSSKSVVHNRLWTNIKPLNDYIQRSENGEPVLDFATFMSKDTEMRRVMIRGLKMCEVFKDDFIERFGVPMEQVFGAQIKSLIDDGMAVDEPNRLALTKKGRTYGTNVYERFYTDDDLKPPQPGEVQFGISMLVLS
jgi:oxygen-independent coproporphyrinogen III oxidase